MGSRNGFARGRPALALSAACPLCFSTGADPQLTAATTAGIFVLLAVTVMVLAGVASVVVSIARRGRIAAQMAAAVEQAHAPAAGLPPAGRRS